MSDIELDTLLAIIGNPTRRSILRKLVKEDHYPLQLSKELSISQQAIMKHLKVLEEAELVKSMFRKSDSGPPRKFYKLAEFMGTVASINEQLDNMARERDELLARKGDALRYANNIIDTLCENYEHRKVLRYLINEDDLSLGAMSERLNMRESEVEKVLRNLEKQGLLMINK